MQHRAGTRTWPRWAHWSPTRAAAACCSPSTTAERCRRARWPPRPASLAATASSHLHKLTAAGLLAVETHGRYRYYRLAGPTVARLIETLGTLAPAAPIRSLRQDTRAAALRRARTCYDHLAGRLGVALMAAFLHRGWLIGGDGTFHADTADHDRLSAPGHDLDYALTPSGRDFLDEFGVDLPPRRQPSATASTGPSNATTSRVASATACSATSRTSGGSDRPAPTARSRSPPLAARG